MTLKPERNLSQHNFFEKIGSRGRTKKQLEQASTEPWSQWSAWIDPLTVFKIYLCEYVVLLKYLENVLLLQYFSTTSAERSYC